MIVKTSTGYRHFGTYGSEFVTDEEGNEVRKVPVVKRGRGRPRKDVGPSGAVYNTGALQKIMTGWMR